MIAYLRRVGDDLDIFLCGFLPGADEGETISHYAARSRPRRWACALCGLLGAVERGHCDKTLAGQPTSAPAVYVFGFWLVCIALAVFYGPVLLVRRWL